MKFKNNMKGNRMTAENSIRVVFLRHGQTDQNLIMKDGGDIVEIDDPLNDRGVAQVLEASEKLKDYKFDAIVSSPLKRALQTAETVNQHHDLPIVIRQDLRERLAGRITLEEWHRLFDIDLNLAPKDAKDGGEDVREFFTRVYREIDWLIDKYKGKTILVVSHGGVNQAFHAYFNSLPWRGNMRTTGLENAGIREYEINMEQK